jgi:hypothetical protein
MGRRSVALALPWQETGYVQRVRFGPRVWVLTGEGLFVLANPFCEVLERECSSLRLRVLAWRKVLVYRDYYDARVMR